MTYKEALDALHTEVRQKALAYTVAADADNAAALEIWEEAEGRYNDMLSKMKSLKAHPEDVVVPEWPA